MRPVLRRLQPWSCVLCAAWLACIVGPPARGRAQEPETPDEAAPGAPAAVEGDAPRCAGTGVQGVVRDAATSETLIEAPVVVVGRGTRVMTDVEGRFALDLPPGTYTLRSYYDLYEPARIENVQVVRGRCAQADIELSAQTAEGEEIIIEVRGESGSEASSLRLRRESAAVQDGVSAEEIRRSPDSDAGQAARRIVGATVLGGQYLFVRGLGGRYTSVLLDGAYLPSSDPDQPGVQLDLFPAAMLDGLTVMKTFTPDLPGDAAGGTMILSTREFPSRFQFGLTLGSGFNTESTFQTARSGPGGALDALGYDDGGRALPAAVPADQVLQPSAAFSADQATQASRAFRPAWQVTDQLVGPNGRLGLHFGDTVMLGARRLGYLVNLGYSASSQVLRNEVVRTVFANEGQVAANQTLTRTSFTQTTQLGGLGGFHLELSDEDDLSLVLLWSQNSESYTGVGLGYDFELDQDVEQTRIRWVERSMYFAQLAGEHRGLPFGMRARWSWNGSLGGRSEPDTRDLVYSGRVGEGPFAWRDIAGSGSRLYLGLDQRETGGQLQFALPIASATVRFGGAFRANERTFSMRRFQYRRADGGSSDVLSLPPDELLASSQIPSNVFVQENTVGTDGYQASQTLAAGFAMLDWSLLPWLRAVGGVRAEGFRQSVLPASPLFPREEGASMSAVDTRRTDVDALGSAGLIFTLAEGMAIRLNYGTTVARPQIREMAPFVYPDFIRLRSIYGQSGLQRTRIDSYDLRWEWFLSTTEVLAVSGFVKTFENPLEMVAYSNSTFSYRNVQGGLNAGAEVEARFGFARIARELSGLDLAANVALVHSRIQMTREQAASSTSIERPLAGQSPYVVNVSLGYSNEDTGLALRLFYNVFGERLVEAGTLGLPDVYQQPFHSFDVTASWRFHPNFEARVGVENLFLDDFLLTQGPVAVQQYNAGMSGSLSLAWRPF